MAVMHSQRKRTRVCALQVSPPIAALAIFAGTFGFVVVLTEQAIRRRRRADDTLMDAVIVKGVKTLALERFEQDAATLVERVRPGSRIEFGG
jgi:hypothetical protein